MLNLKELSKTDPVTRNVEKGLEAEEHTPLDPPGAYTKGALSKVTYEDMAPALRELMDEHKALTSKFEAFEAALIEFRTNNYVLSNPVNSVFSDFFKYFDERLSIHNQKEEKALFPVLNKRLLEAGEHSTGEVPVTAIDVMEDDHVKFIQLGALTFNLLGLATRITDEKSRIFIFETAYNNGRELIELMRLHIFREDHTLFPLAQKLLTPADQDEITAAMKKFAYA